MADDLNREEELEKARLRLKKLGIDVDGDLPEYPSAVLFPDYIPVAGSVLIGMGAIMPQKTMNRRFKRAG